MCTNFAYPTAKDGSVCIGRTMEFPNVIPWQMGIAAKDHAGSSTLTANGKAWQATYGVIGMSAFGNPQWYADAMNTEGLSGHLLYMPNHCVYQKARGDGSDISILDVLAFLLGTCATVAQAKAAIASCNVVGAVPKEIPIELPLHVILHDKESTAVVEFHTEGMRILDNPTRVATNAPYLEWHLTNVTNYLSLSPDNPAAVTINGTAFAPSGQGQGFRGLPADENSPSRFIRVLTNARFATPQADGPATELQAIRLLHGFDLVPGTVLEDTPQGPMPLLTMWSTVANLSGGRYLFNGYDSPQWFAYDLASLDFSTSRCAPMPTADGLQSASF